MLHSLLNTLRLARLRFSGASIGSGSRFGPGVKLRLTPAAGGLGAIRLGPSTDLRDGVVIESWGGEIDLGRNVFVGPYTVMYGHGGITIGDGTLISMHCRILSSNHTIPPVGTTIRSQPDVRLPTKIGADVWLGAGVTVLGGVTIGDGCIVGAGAVVVRDLPSYSICMGVPAVVKSRRG